MRVMPLVVNMWSLGGEYWLERFVDHEPSQITLLVEFVEEGVRACVEDIPTTSMFGLTEEDTQIKWVKLNVVHFLGGREFAHRCSCATEAVAPPQTMTRTTLKGSSSLARE